MYMTTRHTSAGGWWWMPYADFLTHFDALSLVFCFDHRRHEQYMQHVAREQSLVW